MATIISDEELEELRSKRQPSAVGNASIISDEELESTRRKSPAEKNATATIGDYIRAVPATAVDITAGAAEGVASAIGEFTGDYGLARSIAEVRTDLNDAIMGDAPESVKSDFAYKIASGLGSTIPYLGAALLSKRPSLLTKVGANGFFLASAGQQVRDDYLATQGVTSETATDEQMSESVKLGAIGAVPIALAEKLGAGLILNPFTKGAIPAGQVMNRIGQYLSAGAGEAATEVAQSGIINAMASYVGKYDPDRPITQGMAESALIGFLVGGGVNAGVDTVERALTQGDRLKAGVQDGSINANDVIDEDVGSKFAAIAMENDSIPEADSNQQSTITDRNGMSDLISKSLTPLSRRLGRAGKEVVREFRKYELDTGLKLKEFKDATAPFSKRMLELKKKSPEDYKILSQALANANELSVSLPDSVQKDLEKKAQMQPEVTRSSSEQLLDTTNANAQVINEQIGRARKSLEGSGLKTRIQIVESGNSYYDPSTDTIGISAAQADSTTVAHEYFHAVLGQAVKTDVELQSMTRNMFDSVIRATVSGSSLNEQLKGFVSQYDSNVQNEEFLAQTVGELASQYDTLDVNTKTRIKAWINQAMQKLGMQGVFKEAQTDTEVIDQLNAFARFAGSSEGITENMSASQSSQLADGETTALGAPVLGTKFQQLDYSEMPDNTFPDNPLPLSLITKENMVDIRDIMDDVINNNKRVAFFAADQLGVGKNGDYDLDGGPSFAFTKDGVFWMSGSKDKMDNSTNMNKYAEESDYIFVFSGSPTMHTFNKSVFNGFAEGVKSKYKTYDAFRDAFIKGIGSKPNKEARAVIRNLNRYESFDSFRDEGDGSPPPRKGILNYIDSASKAKKDTPTKRFLVGLNLDLDSLRDNFYKENDYGWLDLMVIGKPKGKTQKGDFHSTYADQFMGETIGVPNKKVNLKDILSTQKYNELIEKFVAEKKATAMAKSDEAFTPEATAKRMAGHEAKVAGMKSLSNNPDGQAARIAQEEAQFIAKKEYTDEREATDRLKAEEPQSSAGEKINYSAGGMASYEASELKRLRDKGTITPEQFEEASSGIREQKSRTANDEEIARGLSDDGMRVLEKYGMTEDYRGVRSVLDRIKAEYTELGMDANFIENYFPRYVSDLDGLKASYGQKTGVVDQEIRRYEKMTGRSLNEAERQMMFEKLARSKLYRSGVNAPSNMKERITDFIKEPQMKYYADPEVALDGYIDKMVNAIETKKLIGDTSAGKAKGADPVAGKLGEVMEKLSSEGRLRQDQIEVIQGAVAARFGQHGAQYGFIKGAKNMGYLATMGNVGSTLTQLGDFYFTMVQNGLIPTIEAAFGKKGLTVEDLGIAKDMVEIDSKQGAGMFSKSVNNVFKWTGLTAMDRLAKNTNINATFGVLTKGAKSGQNTNKYKKTLARLKRIQGDDAYKTISDLQRGVKSPYVIEAIYNELADVAPISLTEMPESYAGNPNLRIIYSLKSYTIKQFNFVRERVFEKLYVGLLNKDPKMVGEASVDMARILAFSTLANGSADVLKAIVFNREIDEDDFMWDTLLRLFGVSKYTTVQMRKEGLDTAILKTIAPPQFGMMADVFKDAQEMDKISDMRSVKYMPFVGKLYYWAEGRGVETEERLSRLRSKDLAPSPLSKRKSPNPLGER